MLILGQIKLIKGQKRPVGILQHSDRAPQRLEIRFFFKEIKNEGAGQITMFKGEHQELLTRLVNNESNKLAEKLHY